MAANLSFFLLIGALVFQYWFWFDRVPDLDRRNCQQYAFVFGQVRLNSKASVVLHALMYFWLGLICLYLFLMKLRAIAGLPDVGAQSRRPKKAHVELLQNMDIWMRIVVALGVTVATELTIMWNEIVGVGSLAGVAQTIPFAIGLGAIVRVLYVSMVYDKDGKPGPRSTVVQELPRTEVSSRHSSRGSSSISRPSRAHRR